jgi:hypothetical protein
MLGVILLILKIIGILLLAVLGLLLFVILIVLFTPIRYRVKLEHGEELLILEGKLSWLFHVVRARVSHMNGVFHILVKVLWFTIYDNLQPRKSKPEKRRKKTKQKKVVKTIKGEKESSKVSRKKTEQNIKNRKSSDITEEKQDTINEKTVSRVKETILVDKVEQKKKEAEKQTAEEKKIIEEKQVIIDNQTIEEKQAIAEKQTIAEKQIVADNQIKSEKLRSKEKLLVKHLPEDDVEVEQKLLAEKESFFKRIFIKIKKIKDKIVDAIRSFIERIKKIFESISNIKNKLVLIIDFIQVESNKEAFKITFQSIKKIIKHVLPKELKSELRFGTGDPCSTGQALGALGIVYSFYGDKVQITPDFENKVLEGKHDARGRIRLVTILIIVIKLILDKRFKQLTKNIVVLKEAL